MTAADEAHAEAARRYLGGNSAETDAQKQAAAIFASGAKWQASRDVAEVAVLTTQLQAARAAIRAVLALIGDIGPEVRRVLAASIEQTEAE